MGTSERGVDWYLMINTGTVASPVWTRVGGQRNSPLDRTTDFMDTSDKESSGMKSGLAGMRGWTMSLDLLCQTDDSGWQELEDIWETDRKLAHMRIVRADAVTYTGQAVMSSLSIDPPHDGVVGCAVSFEGADPLVKA